MDALTRAFVRNFLWGVVIPCALGIGVMAAIVLPGSGEELSMARLLTGCSAMILIPAVAAFARAGRGAESC